MTAYNVRAHHTPLCWILCQIVVCCMKMWPFTQNKSACACFFSFLFFSKITIQLKAEDSDRFKTMVQFECRGLEPVDFQPQVRADVTESVTVVYLIPNPKNVQFIIGMIMIEWSESQFSLSTSTPGWFCCWGSRNWNAIPWSKPTGKSMFCEFFRCSCKM